MDTRKQICEPCFRGDMQSEGYSWCSDCEEILCQRCDQAHRVGKLTQNHHLVDLKDIQTVPIPSKNIFHCDIHQDQLLSLYCSFHDDVCCTSCLAETHRTCENIKSIEEVAKNVQSAFLFEDVEQSIPNLLETLHSIRESRQNNADDIICQGKEIQERISIEMTIVRGHLESMEKNLLAQLGKIKSDTLENLESEKLETDKITDVLLKHQQELNFTFKHGSKNKSFLLLQKLKHDICLHEKQVKEMMSATKIFTIDLSIASEQMESTLSSFATIDVSSAQYKNTKTSLKQTNAQVIPATVKFELKHFVTMPSKNAITGMAITNQNQLLLCDWQNEKLLIYKVDGTFIEEQSVNGDPYGIAPVTDEDAEVVITMPLIQRIGYFDCRRHIFTKSFGTNGKYFGIQVIKDQLLVGEKGKIDILAKNCTYIRTIPCDNIGIENIVRYIRIRTDDSILFTDSKKVRCITIAGTGIFEYSDTTTARGIAIDVYGNMYIADKENSNVLRITNDAKASSVVLDESDSIGEPLALCFSKDYTRLFVGSVDSKLVAVFTCKWI